MLIPGRWAAPAPLVIAVFIFVIDVVLMYIAARLLLLICRPIIQALIGGRR